MLLLRADLYKDLGTGGDVVGEIKDERIVVQTQHSMRTTGTGTSSNSDTSRTSNINNSSKGQAVVILAKLTQGAPPSTTVMKKHLFLSCILMSRDHLTCPTRYVCRWSMKSLK